MKHETLLNHEPPPAAKPLLAAGFRYTVYVYFGLGKNHLAEGVKTLKEARTYKEMIDETVRKACIIDKTNGRVVEWWVS
jgi:hypothetical protein